MNKIETKWNLGNFTVAIAHTPASESALETLAALGLRFLGQRNSDVDKILGGFEKRGEKLVRKANWKRNDVGYDGALASALKASFATLELPDESKIEVEAEVSEYVRETATPKYAEVKAMLAAKESTETWGAFLAKLGFSEATAHDADGEYAQALCEALAQRVKAARDAAARATLDALG